MDTITIDWLESHTACSKQIDLFRATFGDSAELTRANLARAVAAGLDLDWLARRILDRPAVADYEAAREEKWAAYLVATAGPRAAYEAATAEAWAAYEAEMHRPQVVFAAYLAAKDEAMAAYLAATVEPRAACKAATAEALADALELPADDAGPARVETWRDRPPML